MDKLINTTVSPNPEVATVALSDNSSITSVSTQVPQIQTTIQDNIVESVTIVNAPFIQVNSVNGMTGDVNLNVKIEEFKSQYYQRGSAVTYNGALYVARNDFTATSFNASDWQKIEAQSVQSDWNTDDPNDSRYIKNKPTSLVQIEPNYNQFTQIEKAKLATIEQGAQRNAPQVQSDWSETSTSSAAYIANKPLNLVQDANYTHTDNNFTTAEKNKLAKNFIEAGVNNIPERYVNLTGSRYYIREWRQVPISLPDGYQPVTLSGIVLWLPVKSGEKWKVSGMCSYLSNGTSEGELDFGLFADRQGVRVFGVDHTCVTPIPSMGRTAETLYTADRDETLKIELRALASTARNIKAYNPCIFAERWG